MNYLAIFVAAVLQMVIGYIWYMPSVFGNAWMKATGLRMEVQKDRMLMVYGAMFVASLVTAFVLDRFVVMLGVSDMMGGVKLAIWIWVGFVAAVMVSGSLFENKNLKWYGITVGYELVCLMVMGGLLAAWR